MKERPILFSTDMVKAVLDDRKTQTRRIVKPQPGNVDGCYHRPDGLYIWTHLPVGIGCGVGLPFKCPYGVVGDRLWVRETFSACKKHVCGFDANGPGEGWIWDKAKPILYRADLKGISARDPETYGGYGWRPSIFMPKWAARLWLEITGIRVERVQEISEADTKAEGVIIRNIGETYWRAFHNLWDSLNAKRGYGWDKNFWVWVIEFKRVQEKPGKDVYGNSKIRSND